MTTESATFDIRLNEDASGAAEDAARALEDLKQEIDEDVAALRQMEQAMQRLKGHTDPSTESIRQLEETIAAQKDKISFAQEQWLELGGTFGKTKVDAVDSRGALERLTDEISRASGPVGQLGVGFGSLRAQLLGGTVFLVASLAGAMITLAATTAKATFELAKYSVAQSDARRSEALRIEGLNTLDEQRRRFTVGAAEMQRSIDTVSDRTNVGRDALAGYARQLARTGLEGDALTEALEAMGFAAQVQGEEGANRFLNLARSARFTGRSVRDLTADYRARLGPIARREMLSLDNQTDRLRSNISELFSGLRVDSFLGSLNEIGDLFSQSTATGRALKQIVEVLFQPLIGQAEGVIPVVKEMFQRMVIGAQNAVITFLELRNTLNQVRIEFGRVGASIDQVFDDSRPEGIIEGLVDGLSGGGTRVFRAMQGIGDQAAAGLRDSLEIRSPSRVFQGFGDDITAGLVAGMDSRLVELAAQNLADSASVTFGGAAPDQSGDFATSIDAGATAEPAASRQVSIDTIHIHIHAGETSEPRELAVKLRDELAVVLRGVLLEMGEA
ncbi:MAG: hypothetical protein AAGE52_42070 [Myxococcota bacterium]